MWFVCSGTSGCCNVKGGEKGKEGKTVQVPFRKVLTEHDEREDDDLVVAGKGADSGPTVFAAELPSPDDMAIYHCPGRQWCYHSELAAERSLSREWIDSAVDQIESF